MRKVFLIVVLCLALPLSYAHARGGHGGGHGGGGHGGGHFSASSGHSFGAPHASFSTGRPGGGYYGGGGGRWYGGYARAGRYYGGRYYGGYARYYYRGRAPRGAVFGTFLGGIVVGGVYSPFWWPFYAVPVAPAYYDQYYEYSYAAPGYVIEVPPTEATTAAPHGLAQSVPPPNQCYAPETDANGNIITENGNMVPDFSKPVPCPPEQ